jgi:hypothetical protein
MDKTNIMNNILNHPINMINKNKINKIDVNVMVMRRLIDVESLDVVSVILMSIQRDVVFHSQIRISLQNAARKTKISF